MGVSPPECLSPSVEGTPFSPRGRQIMQSSWPGDYDAHSLRRDRVLIEPETRRDGLKQRDEPSTGFDGFLSLGKEIVQAQSPSIGSQVGGGRMHA